MNITYDKAKKEDIELIFKLSKQLIDDYETIDNIEYDKVLKWIQKKLEERIREYTVIYADGKKAGYFHFYENEDAEFEIDDLYVFREFQNKGIGSSVICKCCSEVDGPVMLYVFIKNQRAISLYERLGFDIVKTIGNSRYVMKKSNVNRSVSFKKIRIDGIPAVIWGDRSDRMIIAAHGNHSSKIDDCIWILAQEATSKGYQVLSFDLPQHGERIYETDILMPGECVRELKIMYSYAKKHATSVSAFGCSMGAYFEILAFAYANIERAWFLSPVTDMKRVINNLMNYYRISEEELKEKVRVENDIETLYYPYYEYVKNHPITDWSHKTYMLRGENDKLCEYNYVRGFADKFRCELTEQKGAEHWFHTDADMMSFRNWLRKNLG